MTKKFRMAYLHSIYERYRRAAKKIKTQILDELCRICRYNRKYAIRRLAAGPPDVQPPSGRRRGHRRRLLDPRLAAVLREIWEKAHYPWSARLREILRLWRKAIQRRYRLSEREERILLSLSPRTIDRALQAHKLRLKHRLYGRTKPGRLLKHQIPIKTEHWDVDGPGFTEVDTVSHSGSCAEGLFIYSVNWTDIYTQWVETRAVMGKGEVMVLEAIQQMRQALPFALRGLDADNGSEFINHHLVRYCTDEKIQFTRSRAYKKDDNAHIEQKNWTHVRKLLGWDRYDSPQALQVMNDLYANELRLYMNLFQPSVKLLKTERRGSRLKRLYDKPLTPLDRLIASGQGDRLKIAHLKAIRERTDPFALAQTIDAMLRRIWRLAHHRMPRPASPDSSGNLTPQQRDVVQIIAKIFGVKSVRRKEDGPTA